jgi:hypothetical protein
MVEKRSHFQRTSCFGHLLSTSKKTAQHIRTNRCSWNFLLCFARASPNCCTLPKVVCIKKQPKFNGYNNLLVITCTFSMKIALWRVLAQCSDTSIALFPALHLSLPETATLWARHHHQVGSWTNNRSEELYGHPSHPRSQTCP